MGTLQTWFVSLLICAKYVNSYTVPGTNSEAAKEVSGDDLSIEGIELIQTQVSLPKLPSCSASLDSVLFERIWNHFVQEGQQKQKECQRPLTIFIPQKLRDFIPADAANPFVVNEDLKQKTVFSHVFDGNNILTNDGELEKTVLSFGGGQVVLKKDSDGSWTADGYPVLECESRSSDDCIQVYSVDGVLSVTHKEVMGVLNTNEHLSNEMEEDQSIIFRHFDLPGLTQEVEQILRQDLKANVFVDMWKNLLGDINTKPIDADEVIILAPSDKAFKNLIPELKKSVENPLKGDLTLQRHILGNHIITKKATIPSRLVDTVPEYQEIIKVNLMGENVVFHRENTKGGGSEFKANGEKLSPPLVVESNQIFGLGEVLFVNDILIKDAINRMALKAGVTNPFPDVVPSASIRQLRNPHLASAYIPRLDNRVSFALRTSGADTFARIWYDVKEKAQTQIAAQEGDPCLLPKEVGSCRQTIGKFYFDSETRKCLPFIYGGCEGNSNRFDTLLQCSETCIRDSKEKQIIRDRTCKLPKYQYELTRSYLKGRKCEEGKSPGFHFNSETQLCEEFVYEGCFGTDNVFKTLDMCQLICEELAQDTNDKFDEIEPSSFEEDVDICSLSPYRDSPVQRSCKAKKPEWFYDPMVRKCSAFFYDGCGATQNLFNTEYECKQICSLRNPGILHIYAPNDGALRDLFAKSGAGREIFRLDSDLGKHFILTSLSYEECIDPDQEITTLHPDVLLKCKNLMEETNVFDGTFFRIHLTSNLQISANDIRAVASENSLSAEFRNSLSNSKLLKAEEEEFPELNPSLDLVLRENGFDQFADAWKNARQSQELQSAFQDICSFPKDQGDNQGEEDQDESRFYFDSASGFCQQFRYSGSGGNENNFITYEDCTNICGTFQGRVANVNILLGGDGQSLGNLTLTQASPSHPVLIRGHLKDISPGLHGFHIHEIGDLSNGCKAAGGHYNPNKENHGGPEASERHVGDLGNILGQEKVDDIKLDISDDLISLYETNVVIGRAVVIHEGEDDLGQGQNDGSRSTGNAGGRLACGIITEVSNVMVSKAVLTNGLEGELVFTQHGPLSPVKVTGTVKNLEPGLHGFHVHQSGDLGNNCKSSGGHFNPFQKSHGSPDSKERHVGDLGNIYKLDADNSAKVEKEDFLINLYPGKTDINHRAVVIHAQADDFGLGGHRDSLKTGNAGGRVGCGVIEPHSKLLEAEVALQGPKVTGNLKLTQTGVHGKVRITGKVEGLTSEGKHGFHVHEFGALGNQCKDAGGHYNPMMFHHSSKESSSRHVGDLGNIVADANGVAEVDLEDDFITLEGEYSILTRAIVVHAGEDDLGTMENDPESKKTGNAGSRVACGIIYGKSEPLIVVVPKEQVSNDITSSNLILDNVAKGELKSESQAFSSIGGKEINIETDEHDSNKVVSVNGIPVKKVIHQGGFVMIHLESIKNRNGPDELIILPVQDPSLKSMGQLAKVADFYDIWDRYLNTDIAVVDPTALESTIVAVEDFKFRFLIPADAPNPFVLVPDLQKKLLGASIVNRRIDPNDPSLKSEEGVQVTTVGGFKLTFKQHNDQMMVNEVAVKTIQTSSNSVLYVLEDVINISPKAVVDAISKLPPTKTGLPVELPPVVFT